MEYYFAASDEKGFSQEELAKKVFVTRQVVSRWENGENSGRQQGGRHH
ncbi:MAG: helix-turn-helix transcriptional regulator [Spirochaetaceae bacterium]|nr:helix-turn-helix transcriptional regulator [Spirochaetaceae bacterium]